MKTKTDPKQQATNFINACKNAGWKIEHVSASSVTISKRFTPGDKKELVECDMEYYDILSYAPHKGGSIWGTDCGGIGALSALNSGLFRMHKSGQTGGARFATEVKKQLAGF